MAVQLPWLKVFFHLWIKSLPRDLFLSTVFAHLHFFTLKRSILMGF